MLLKALVMLLLLSSRRLRLQQRSFSLMIEQPATQADRRTLIQRGKIEERRRDETVSIDSPIAEEQDGV